VISNLSRAELFNALKQCRNVGLIPPETNIEKMSRPQLEIVLDNTAKFVLKNKQNLIDEDELRRANESEVLVLGMPISRLTRDQMAEALGLLALKEFGFSKADLPDPTILEFSGKRISDMTTTELRQTLTALALSEL
jgi:hypothetical protein